jgi:hypothetical protein
MPHVDPEVEKLAHAYIARGEKSRGALAVRAMLEHGSVSTEDLNRLGYDHPPRAIADAKDNGIPVNKEMVRSSSGKRMARYFLGTAEQIRVGQVGRTNFSKKFRDALFATYGSIDCITGAKHDPRSLQIDHRIPYRVSGDAGLATGDVDAFMLLDARSNRAKGFSCQNCRNFIELLDPEICRSCFWAYPEDYGHVAMEDIRRADVVWKGAEVSDYDALSKRAEEQGLSVPDLLKLLGRTKL